MPWITFQTAPFNVLLGSLSLKLPHVFSPLWRLLQSPMYPWGIHCWKRGPGTVTIAILKPQVPALIKILISLQTSWMSLFFFFFNWTPFLPLLCHCSQSGTFLHSLIVVIKQSQHVKSAWGQHIHFCVSLISIFPLSYMLLPPQSKLHTFVLQCFAALWCLILKGDEETLGWTLQ